MAITLNDCFTNAELPAGSANELDAIPDRPRHRVHAVDPHEADQLVAAFLASGRRIKTYPPAYAARSSQYHVVEPPTPQA